MSWRVFVFAAFIAVAPAGAFAAAAGAAPRCGDDIADRELSIKLCTRLIEFGALDRSNLAKAYATRAVDWAALGNHDRAINDSTIAIDLDPKLATAYVTRALSLSDRRERERAIEDYTTAIKLAPKDTAAYQGRAVELAVNGEFKRALADYEEILRLEPESLAGVFGRGRARFYAGDVAGAAADFERAHKMQQSVYSALWLYLARKRAGQPAEKMLPQEAGTRGDGEWPAAVVGLYLGRFTPQAVLNEAGEANLIRRRHVRCEATFYVAQWHLLRNATAPATELLLEAEKLCPSTFIEHEGASAELRRLARPG